MTEYNHELWNERWNNVQSDISSVNNKLDSLIKVIATGTIAIIGWLAVQVYSNLTNGRAEAAPVQIQSTTLPPHSEVPK